MTPRYEHPFRYQRWLMALPLCPTYEGYSPCESYSLCVATLSGPLGLPLGRVFVVPNGPTALELVFNWYF
jgi:hypothetical protein